MRNNTILVTGANGFVGSSLCELLEEGGFNVKRGVRTACNSNEISYGSLCELINWSEILRDVDTVIHLAARVHICGEGEDSLDKYLKVNLEATKDLALQAREAGVRRFIFLSSVKVNGDHTLPGQPFKISSSPFPSDPYGVSKHEAEKELLRISKKTGLEVVIIRPPLVYGRGVKANFKSLLSLVEKLPIIPLGGISNKRSFVSLLNLNDLIRFSVDSESACGKVLLVSDGDDLSTTELVEKIAKALKRKPLLLAPPKFIFKLLLFLIGKSSAYSRLFGNLQVDITSTSDLIGWKPPFGVDEALSNAVLNSRS